jgi:hypothetical protein
MKIVERRWYVLDVMWRSNRRRTWVALLIDVDPESFVTGQMPATESRLLYLGKHRTYDGAWRCAERLLISLDAAPLVLPCGKRRSLA